MASSLRLDDALRSAAQAYLKPPGFRPFYGTAGYRALAPLLPSTVFRCGVLMAVRSLLLDAPTGICITASHNPAPDNGVKLVEPTGEMLTRSWEAHADSLACAESTEAFLAAFAALLEAEGIVLPPSSSSQSHAGVYIAHDTRPSSPGLAEAARVGAAALGVPTHDLGLLTTPQLHWAVARTAPGEHFNEDDYFAELAGAYAALVSRAATGGGAEPADGGAEPADVSVTGRAPLPSTPTVLHVDCANGVGAPKLLALADRCTAAGLHLTLHNTGEGALNGRCGADFVQKARLLPDGLEGAGPSYPCCSLDGDADRIVFFVPGTGAGLTLLDGDRIAALAALLCADLAAALPRGLSPAIGVVQTAYANGAATRYLTEALRLPVTVTPTGVKHLHAAAHAHDVGIYFEANGHGTVLFAPAYLLRLKEFVQANADDEDPTIARAVESGRDLLALSLLVNQTVGDALSILLLVVVALRRRGWTLEDWAGIYRDLPSRQSVRSVADRSVIVTADAERRVARPAALQPAIDAAVAAAPQGRAFVRPSGTEDVVRIYAEAATQEDADALAAEVSDLVALHAGGL
ncbi:PHM1 [Auxenochlorella protothecoides x Auxenochlorella symbiontica]|uniref:phosphoacetylglucosamine mutase n=1 Tax=Auxenochlorella protothecoides TaxID=3075 RepID=A0A1D2A894_AUXPR